SHDVRVYILSCALVEKHFGEEAQILETFKGKSLEGKKYEPLFDFLRAVPAPNIGDASCKNTQRLERAVPAPEIGDPSCKNTQRLERAVPAPNIGDASCKNTQRLENDSNEKKSSENFCANENNFANKNFCTVVCDDYVTLTDGTGIVHIAPAFGEDDARISKAYDLPLLQFVDAQGNFTSEAHLWTGKFVKDADPLIIKELAARGQLFKKAAYTHNYPFCWRCDTPLLYYARDAWFIRTSSLRDNLLASNNEVNWFPAHMKDGRFGNFLENVIDWSISRERYWGTPLPIWICENENCGHLHCVGSIAELKKLNPSVANDLELHKPYIDAVKIPCPKCAAQMTRTPEVIDCWFDSGAMPFAQWHYPFENEKIFAKQFPADFISEAVDQTRGWFYSLISISTMLFEKSPYKNVIVLGHGLDENGVKMSKSKGNAVNPMEALEKHGADAMRSCFISSPAPRLRFRYADTTVTEGARRFMGTLWNTYAFYCLYAEIDSFNPYEHEQTESSVMDKWLLSRLNTLIQKVDSALERFELTEPARALDAFVDDMSNWYLRRSRERFWVSEKTADKISAYKTLHHALVTVAKLAAPFVPFITEQIYRNLVVGLDKTAPASVHLTDFPVADERAIDSALESQMSVVIDIVVQGRSARNIANMKIRQPLCEMLVCISREANLDAQLLDVIKDELNVKEIRFIDDASQYTSCKFKPQLRTLGPRYGKLVPKITEALNAAPNAAMDALKAGVFTAQIDGTLVELTLDDVLIETTQTDGFSAANEKGVTVVLNTRLTPELIEEGNMRELISKWQNMRREADFEVTDHIAAGFFNCEGATLPEVIAKNEKTICAEILAKEISQSAPPENSFAKEWNVNGEKIELWVKK
ncbi:MAG: class I tRNA ligase family protein, partial [Defluviitaleaceae bacterium]|nr:class I tRNA ligase family protein [Defluviitaleaceae bacterium]